MIYEFNVGKRDLGRVALAALREVGKIPGVVYGPEVKENVLVACDRAELEKLFKQAGEASLVNVKVEGESEPRETLIKEVTFDVLTDFATHVDFYQVKKGQKLTLAIPIKFIGDSPAVKAHGGLLIKNLEEITITCLPKDLVNSVTVDISKLATLEDRIRVKDLGLPASVDVQADPEQIIALVTVQVEEIDAPKAVEEEAKKDEPAAAAKGEAEKPAKK